MSGMTGSSIKHVNVLSLAALVRFFLQYSLTLFLKASRIALRSTLCRNTNSNLTGTQHWTSVFMAHPRPTHVVVDDGGRDTTHLPRRPATSANHSYPQLATSRNRDTTSFQSTSFSCSGECTAQIRGQNPTVASVDDLQSAYDADDCSRHTCS